MYLTWTAKISCPFFILKGITMKYLMALFAGMVLSLSFAACGEDNKDTGSADAEIVDTGAQDVSDTGDLQDSGDETDTGSIEDSGVILEEDTGDLDASLDTGE